MKTLNLTIVILMLSVGVYAKSGKSGSINIENKAGNNAETNPSNGIFTSPDAIWMKNGKVMLFKGDLVYILESDITLSDGTLILNNGTIGKPDSTVIILKEGEHLDYHPTIPQE